eukprot:12608788-Ditylum_brightwellii.AAC.1
MAGYDIFAVKETMDGDKFVFSLPPYKGKPNKPSSQTFNYAQQCMHLLPKVGIIESSDGGINHAIGICQNWIFDSNLPHAMELTKFNLDWCATSNSCAAKFVQFDTCYVHVNRWKRLWERKSE